jgi:hypothetical protein
VGLHRRRVRGFKGERCIVDCLGGLCGWISHRRSGLLVVEYSGLAVQTGPRRIQRLEASLQSSPISGHDVSDGIAVVFARVSGYHDFDDTWRGECRITIK